MKDQFIGLMVEDKPFLVMGLLAILKSRNVFVPVNPVFPDNRIHFILNDANIQVLVTDEAHYSRALEIAQESPVVRHLLCIDGISGQSMVKHSFKERGPAGSAESVGSVEPVGVDQSCYVIYTSGSSGRPKGVPITHRNLNPLFFYSGEYLHLGPHTRVMKNLSYTFDFGIFEIFSTLLFGGRLFVLNKSSLGDFSHYAYFINRQQINTLHTTPVFLNNLANTGQKMPSIKCIHLGGEQLTGQVIENTLAVISPGCILYNGYGPTEASINCTFFSLTWAEMKTNSRENIPIGKPCDFHEIYILDKFLNPQPLGAAGELCIAGPGLTQGYLNRPELTNQTFLEVRKLFFKKVFGPRRDSLFYQTGDLARWSTDGNMEFLGRIDQQVKVRGFRIELGEIESCLSLHPLIKENVVMAREHANGDNYLCAYIVFKTAVNLSISQLREFLLNRLPGYMIPAYFIQVEKIPVSPNGKIDHKALPPPAETFIDTGVEYQEPLTVVEKKLVSSWQQLLRLEKIGIMDDFFQLGGDSILVNRCMALIREEMQVEMPLRKFFERPFIKALAEEIEKQERQLSVIKPAARGGEIPLSFSQERLWFLQELDAGNTAYFVPRVIRMKGKLDVPLLERTFTEIIRRHEILRTVFLNVDGRPVQRIQSPYRFKIPIVDLGRLEKEELERQVSYFLNEESRRPFDFEKGPLLRVSLLKLAEKEHLFVLTEHHLIHDGWTQGVLLKEFIAIFSAYREGKNHDLADLPIQYADYAIWERSYLQGERLKRHLDYWQEKLSGLEPVLELPGDRPRPALMSGRGVELEFHLPAVLSAQLEEFSRRRGVTLFMSMLAVFQVLLYRYTNAADICVGTGIANRSHKEMEGMLGMVINTLPLRTATPGDMFFGHYLGQVKETCLEAYQHQDTPFGKIVEVMAQERSLKYNPLFQVMFAFMDTPTEGLWLPGLELNLEPIHNFSAKFDVSLVVVPPSYRHRDEILVEWEYSSDIFDPGTMERMIGHYIRLLEEAVRNPGVCIADIPMLDEAERRRLLVEWNDTGVEYPAGKTIHGLFAEQVENSPDRVALVGPTLEETLGAASIQITYRQLDERSDGLAGLLIQKGVRADNIVGIMLERSIEMMVGIYGILKAGGAYLPIDPHYPRERIDYMLKDSNAKFLINKSEARISKFETNPNEQNPNDQNKNQPFRAAFVLNFENLDFDIVSNFGFRISNFISSNLAYIIYTSGSTGKPKGVLITHAAVVNRLFWVKERYGLTERDVVLQSAPFIFDVSVCQFFRVIPVGARLCFLPPGGEMDPGLIVQTIGRYSSTTVDFVPAIVNLILDYVDNIDIDNIDKHKSYRDLASLVRVFCGVEAVSLDLVKRFEKTLYKFNNTQLINAYGPTEGTVDVTYFPCTEDYGKVPIGKPIANVRVYILDKYGNLQPQGVGGELCIAGKSLARGYLNSPGLTAEKFSDFHRSSSRIHHSILYRTGDRARWLNDGNIEFLGRFDSQVKIRGFRVELGEIEDQLTKYKDIKEAVVIAGQNETGDHYLCAYIVPRLEQQVSVPGLREYLGRQLPDYMIPAYFIALEKIPLTMSGKINRGALPAPALNVGENYTAPRHETEKKLEAIWSGVLAGESSSSTKVKPAIGIDDNFFQLGGHSLKATILAARIHNVFNIKIPLAEIFTRPTIRGLAEYIDHASYENYTRVEPVEKKEYYALSSMQKQLFFLRQMDKDSVAYNLPAAWVLAGIIDTNKVTDTFIRLIERHESFRTSFVIIGEEPVQRIHEEVEHKSFAALFQKRPPGGPPEAYSRESLLKFIQPFDLAHAPLLRVGLVKLEAERHLFMVDMHHIIADGISIQVLAKDFTALYAGKELPEIKLQYKDYAEWQERERKSKTWQKQEIYWREQFAGEVPVLELPADYRRTVDRGFVGKRIDFVLDSEITNAINVMVHETGTTLFMVMSAIYSIFLAKLSSREDIVIGTPVAGRRHADLEKIIGMFVNTLAIRHYPLGEKRFIDFLAEVKIGALNAFENQEYPYESLVEELDITRDAGRNPLFDTMLVWQDTQDSGAPAIEIPGVQIVPYPPGNNTSKFDLTLIAGESAGRLEFNFEYATPLFKSETIARFIVYFKNLVGGICENKKCRISGFEILPVEEKNRLLYEFNETEAGYPWDQTIHRLFAEQVEKGPDRIALVGADRCVCPVSVSYRKLAEQSGRLAGGLIERGVAPGDIVGIMIERSVEMMVGIMGILKAGAAYLPIDPDYPRERIDYMLKDSGAGILIKSEIRNPKFETNPNDSIIKNFNFNSANPAYIIYTSGTTGNPKGVQVTHRNVVRLMINDKSRFDFSSSDIWTLFHSYCFDFSVWEMYGALLYGGKLVIVSKRITRDAVGFRELLNKEAVTVLNQTPSAFYNVIDEEIDTRLTAKKLYLRYVIFGGEALNPLKLRAWHKKYPQTRLVNMYGITETTVHVTYKEIGAVEVESNTGNIGKPIPTLSVYILDNYLKPVPIGVVGEIYVGGDGVAGGYLNRPELTAERFCLNNQTFFRGSRGAVLQKSPPCRRRLYKSGDLGRYLINGDIEYLGRKDQQVKIRGFRVEIGEIENRLLKHKNIRDVVVIDGEDKKGDKYLSAYIVADTAVTVSQMRGFLAAGLPGYMIPSYFVIIDKIPLNPNGKLDRKALPGIGTQAGGEYAPARDLLDEKLQKLWQEVLGKEAGIDDNFFHCGGHSLKATLLVAKIHKTLRIEIPVAQVFKTPHIRDIADYIKTLPAAKYTSLENVEKKAYYSLAPAQQRLYILQQMNEKGTGYNIPYLAILAGEIDKNKLENAFKGLVHRHESLRTSFHMIETGPVQRIHEQVDFEIAYYNLATEGTEVKDLSIIIRRFIQPFELSRAPLLRVGLISLEEKKHLLMADIHHIISDGASQFILEKELPALYEGKELSPLRFQYKDYSEWFKRAVRQEIIQKQEAYWLKEFPGEIPVIDLPFDFKRPVIQGFEGDTLTFDIDRDAADGLNKIAMQEEATPFMIIAGIFVILLAKLSGQEDIVVGTDIEGRRYPDTQEIIGMFVNTLAIRYFPTDGKIIREFIAEVKNRALNAFENQDYPFDELVEKISPVRDTGRNPLFDILFSYLDIKPVNREDFQLKLESYPFKWKTAKFDLTLNVHKIDADFRFSFEYSTKLFRAETIRRLVKYFKRVLAAVTVDTNCTISQIQVLSEAEKNQILYEFNDTKKELIRDKCYARLFEEQAARTPDNIAAVNNDRGITYKALNETANRIAAILSGHGITPGQVVALYLKRSPAMTAAIIGVFKAGGAYVPLDAKFPQERIDYMLENSGAKILITKSEIRNPKFETNPNDFRIPFVLNLDDLDFEFIPGPGFREPDLNPSNLAYIIYTSGSTGKPKGVMIQQLGMINHLYAKISDLGISGRDIIAQTASACFDISVWQFLAALLTGGNTCIIDDEILLGGKRFLRELQRCRVTILETVPSLMNVFLEITARESDKEMAHLRWMIPTGEPLTVPLAREWFRQYPDIKMVNAYGPTEASDDVTHYILSEAPPAGQTTVPIGKPIQNTHIYILDRNLSLCPIGVKGEICVSGLGVGQGYWKEPGKTADVFIPNPFRQESGDPDYTRLYKTGDIGYYREDGYIECLGRLDHQVKIRGNRIELEEIEQQILNYGTVKKVVVIAKEDKQGSKYLCAYLAALSNIAGLKDYLLKRLPGYMVPNFFVVLGEIPLTPNGKVDRNALPDPVEINAHENPGMIPAPASVSPLEKQLIAVWENVLGRKNIRNDDNFFMMGGDSIKALQVTARISSAGYKLEMRDIFQYPTPAELASHIKKLKHIPDQSVITGIIPLTPIQGVFFNEFFNASYPAPHHYNQAVLFCVPGGTSKGAIEYIFSAIQAHHDALRMTYKRDDNGQVIQVAHGLDFPLSIQEYDLRDRENPPDELNSKINQIQAGIDLEKGPLLKLGLFHLNDGDRLLIVSHHLVIDGVSWRIICEDMETLYRQYKEGREPKLPPKTDSFKTWAEKLQAYANSQTFLQEKTYWQKIEALEVPPIPKDFNVTGDNIDNINDAVSVSFTLSDEQTGLLLTKVNRVFRTEVNDILLTALAMGINKTFSRPGTGAGFNRVAIALEGHGRESLWEDIDISRTVGWFTAVYPAVLDITHPGEPGQQVKEIKETLRRIPNKGIGHGILKNLTREENKKEIQFKLKPQIGFNYLGQFDADLKQISSFTMAEESTGNSQSPDNKREYLLEVSGITAGNRLTMSISYNKTHFQPGTIAALAHHFEFELKHLIAFCSTKENSEFTPADFTYKDLSIANVDRITALYPNLEDIYTLTPMQEGMLFHSLMDHAPDFYFQQVSYRVHGELDIHLVEKSLNELLKRYDILRTAFVYKDIRRPVQVVLATRTVDFYYEDIYYEDIHKTGDPVLEKEEKEHFIKRFKEKDKERSFDLSRDVLVRVSVLRTANRTYEFIWSTHHILMDGWCVGIIAGDFFEIYAGYREGRPYHLPAVKPYRTYVQWLEKQDKEKSARYWENYLDSFAEQTGIPGKCPVKEESRYDNETLTHELTPEMTDGLHKLAAANQATLNIVARAIWGVLLGKYNNTEDVVFGAVVSGRPPDLEGVESMVGLFINTIPVRIRFAGSMEFYRLIQHVRQEALAGEPYHYHPLAEIQARTPLKQKLIDHLFIFENYPIAEQIAGQVKEKLEKVEVFEQTNYDFNIVFSGTERLAVTLAYNSRVYNKNWVERIAGRFCLVAAQVIENRELQVGDLTLLSEHEIKQLLYEFNNSKTEYPHDKTIHELFAEQAKQTPSRRAVVSHLDLTPIYNELESSKEEFDARLTDEFGKCCFKKNPFLFHFEDSTFITALDFFDCEEIKHLHLLRTHKRNYVAVNHEVYLLLNCFDGRTNVKSLFAALVDKKWEFQVFPVIIDAAQGRVYHERKKYTGHDTLAGPAALVKALYRANLIDLADYRTEIIPTAVPRFDQDMVKPFSGLKEIKTAKVEEACSFNGKPTVLLLGDRTGDASTGLLYIASFLRRNGINAYCRWNDFNKTKESLTRDVLKLLETIKPGIVGVSMKWFPHIARALEICKIVKKYDPAIIIVVGGNTASYYKEKIIRCEYVDYVIAGDGEVPLLKLCLGEEYIPNCVYKTGDRIVVNPIDYVQDEKNSADIYLSHLETIYSSPLDPFLAADFYINTGKGCSQQCVYCAGCSAVQAKTFNRHKPFFRGTAEVRKDIGEARKYTTTFMYDLDLPQVDTLDYYTRLWEGMDLTGYFCVFYFWMLPKPEFIELVARTFKYVYFNIDICSLSEKHRLKLSALKMVKPQPTDEELFQFFEHCSKYNNQEVIIDLIAGLPYFTAADIEAGKETLAKLTAYPFFSGMDWGRLHAQPGAPIVESCQKYDMHSYAHHFEDFLHFSELNLEETVYPEIMHFNYPYIYFNDQTLNAKITQYYIGATQGVEKSIPRNRRNLDLYREITYEELDRKAGLLAGKLKEKGVIPGTIIGLYIDRSLEMIIGLLAILKAGAVYLPLDPRYPADRVKYMLEDSRTRMVLTGKSKALDLPFNVEKLDIADERLSSLNNPFIKNAAAESAEGPGGAESMAYVLYTSGSTGKPRGVWVGHGNVVRLVKNSNYLPWDEGEKLLLTGSIGFDITTFEIWGPLLNGAILFLAAQEIILDGARLELFLNKNNISIMHLIPQLFNQMAELYPGIYKKLKYLLVGGDIVGPHYVNKIRNRYPALKVLHMYGPTENTTFSTYFPVNRDYEYSIPIGVPIGNSTVYIIDKYGHLQPVGLPGEISVGGAGLACGYLNRPELTAEKFRSPDNEIGKAKINKSFCGGLRGAVFSKKAPLLYRTGDLGRWSADGQIEFMGRIDQQVKIRGFRIELGEIETRLQEIEHIKQVAVIDRQRKSGEKYLCAYLVTDKAPDIVAIKNILGKRLPDYMVPRQFIPVESIPLTPHGKVDRRALMDMVPPSGSGNYTSPKSKTEKIIAQIWKETLDLDRVGSDENFFEAGGTSLDINRVTNRLRETFNRDIPTAHLFQYPTIGALAKYFDREESDDGIPCQDGHRQAAAERGKKNRINRLQKRRGDR